ncbi:unnamed protein product [Cuscuta campestris]|uniref:CCHC-type domain-containing protein n=1 Tax=Cuscuta campestris TaxID=132261 RepID=A0A484LY17_9ASTE|nr:unnamed protein product [Cuscuta campestris]
MAKKKGRPKKNHDSPEVSLKSTTGKEISPSQSSGISGKAGSAMNTPSGNDPKQGLETRSPEYESGQEILVNQEDKEDDNNIVQKVPTYAEVLRSDEVQVDLSFFQYDEINGQRVARITEEDIIVSKGMWDCAIICCVLGANPPLEVMKGFVTRLGKLGSILGKPIKRDKATATRTKLDYARIQIEVQVHQDFPDTIKFVDNGGRVIEQPVSYDWKPSICSKCGKLGHVGEHCRKKEGRLERVIQKKIWRPKIIVNDNIVDRTIENTPRQEPMAEDNTPANARDKDEDREEEAGFKLVTGKKAARRKGGSPIIEEDIRDFKACVTECDLEELPSEGPFFTWSNRQNEEHRIYSKLDRALVNIECASTYNCKIKVLGEGVSDHSPLIIKDLDNQATGKAFRFCNMWMEDKEFPIILQEGWLESNNQRNMYQVLQNLKRIKGPLKRLHKEKYWEIHKKVDDKREQLLKLQEAIKTHTNQTLINKERELTRQLNETIKASYLLKCQQSKQSWITEGDKNSKLFYAWVKRRQLNNYIMSIQDNGVEVEGTNAIAKVLESFYKRNLGATVPTGDIEWKIFDEGKVLTVKQQLKLIEDFQPEHVRKAMFSIPSSKSPGPDGLKINRSKSEVIFGGSEPRRRKKIVIHVEYETRIFILPKGVIKKVMAICRNFLWGGTAEYHKVPLVQWDEVCQLKKYGGLGIRNIMNWNLAAIMKLNWDVAGKKDILWVKWIHTRYIKNGDFWTYHPKLDSCYYWREMLRVRNKFKDMPHPKPYEIREGYNWLQGKREKPVWRHWVWNKFTPPKFRFIIWLLWRRKLQTKMRLAKFLNIDTKCELCGRETETQDHLVWSCDKAKTIGQTIMKEFGCSLNCNSEGEFAMEMQKVKGGKMRKMAIAIWATAVYFTWKWRNDLWHKKVRSLEEIQNQAIYYIRSYFSYIRIM